MDNNLFDIARAANIYAGLLAEALGRDTAKSLIAESIKLNTSDLDSESFHKASEALFSLEFNKAVEIALDKGIVFNASTKLLETRMLELCAKHGKGKGEYFEVIFRMAGELYRNVYTKSIEDFRGYAKEFLWEHPIQAA